MASDGVRYHLDHAARTPRTVFVTNQLGRGPAATRASLPEGALPHVVTEAVAAAEGMTKGIMRLL